MHITDYTATWAARLANPTAAELAILRAIAGAPRAPETAEGYSEALYNIRALWTGPATAEASETDVIIPDGLETTPDYVSASDFRAAVGETVKASRNGRRG